MIKFIPNTHGVLRGLSSADQEGLMKELEKFKKIYIRDNEGMIGLHIGYAKNIDAPNSLIIYVTVLVGEGDDKGNNALEVAKKAKDNLEEVSVRCVELEITPDQFFNLFNYFAITLSCKEDGNKGEGSMNGLKYNCIQEIR